MRFVLGAAGEVEVPAGVTLRGCRAGFAALTRDPTFEHAPLSIDGRTLVEDHTAGAPPWVTGSVLRPGPSAPDPHAQAATALWHLAVVDGPDAGMVAVPGRDGTVRVGRGGQPVGVHGRLTLTDAAVSRDHVEVRLSGRSARPARPGRRRRPHTWSVTDLGSANGTSVSTVRAGGPDRARNGRPGAALRGRRRLSLRPGDRLTIGASTLVARTIDDIRAPSFALQTLDLPHGIATRLGDPEGRLPADPAGDRAGQPGRAPSAGASASALTWMLPAAASVVLALSMRNPLFLVLVLSGPLARLVPAMGAAVRSRRAASADDPRRTHRWQPAPDPAWCSVRLATDGHQLPAGTPLGAVGSTGAPPVDEVPAHQVWVALARDGLAVVGPRTRTTAAVRTLVGAALLDPSLDVTVLSPERAGQEWAWCRWVGARVVEVRGSAEAGPAEAGLAAATAAEAGLAEEEMIAAAVVVCDGSTPWRRTLDRWWVSGRRQGSALLLIEEDRDSVPPWCRWTMHVSADGRAFLSTTGAALEVDMHGAPAAWMEAHARRAAARAAQRPVTAERIALPDRVALADLGVAATTTALLEVWGCSPGPTRRELPHLRAAVGVGAAGQPVTVDLLTEGPHLLVAGTTGSGKSELLQALVLSLALQHPPSELAVVLVDYKGGASFGRCRDLPHVVGEVTDLDPVEAGRALDGVRAELHRRERVLAEAGVGDLESLRRRWASPRSPGEPGSEPPPARLLVVVDEFRALAEDLPEFIPRLVRIAAQGRSLGIHLVLATQRPAGAVSAQMRANVALRLCLRVTDAADSLDVVDVADAAALPATSPGRAVLRRGSSPPETVQTAWAALPPSLTSSPAQATSGPRWAPAWTAGSPAADPDTGGRTADHTRTLVAMAREAAERGRLAAPPPVWLPPLPDVVRSAGLVDAGLQPTDASGGLPLALSDLPAEQTRGRVVWDGLQGALVVAGRPGSGRTGVLRAAVDGALARGWDVHVVTGISSQAAPLVVGRPADSRLEGARAGSGWPGSAPPSRCDEALPMEHPLIGTVTGAEDPQTTARLLTALLAESPRGPRLLVVDDVGLVAQALDRMPRGCAADLLERTVREGRHRGLRVAVSGSPVDVRRLVPHCDERLVLAVADPHDDTALGVPRGLAAGREVPGRAVHVSSAGAVRCQVVLVGSPAGGHDRGTGDPGDRNPDPDLSGDRNPDPAPDPDVSQRAGLRLLPAPRRVVRTGLGTGERWLVPVGRGGDRALVVSVDAGRGVLVAGPAGSGRSTALATLALGLREQGLRTVVVASAGPLSLVGEGDPARHARTGAQAAALLRAHPADAVVIDDLDLLGRTGPDVDDLVAGWVAAAEAGDRDVPRVLGSARTDRAATAYRGAVAALRSSAGLLVLAPATPGSHDVAGQDLSLMVDPTDPRRPGYAALADRGSLTCVQVAVAEPP